MCPFIGETCCDIVVIDNCRERLAKYDEGSGDRAKFIQEQARLEAIREKMCKDLEDKGVNPKYMSEMRNVDIKKILNR